MSSVAQLPVESRPLSFFKMADYNPRSITPTMLKQLKTSLREYGFIQPVIAREDGLVVGGHQRLTAYGSLLEDDGLTEAAKLNSSVPVVILKGLTDARTKALNLALNKISGDWDYGKLADVLDSIKDVPELELTGFSSAEFDDLMTVIGRLPDLAAAANPEGENIDDALAANERRLVIVMPTKDDAVRVKTVLTSYGMTSPKQGGLALAAMVADLLNLKQGAPVEAAPVKRTKGKKS